MGILDLTNPLVLFAAVLIYAFLFILGKEFKKSSLTAISLVLFLITLGIYAIQLVMSDHDLCRLQCNTSILIIYIILMGRWYRSQS